MAAEDFYRYLKRRISKCDLSDTFDVLWAYSQLMQLQGFVFPDHIEKHLEFQAGGRQNFLFHEWELELLAAEAILHASNGTKTATKTMRNWSTISHIVNRLRNLENALYGENSTADVLVEMSRIIHRQVPWQQLRPKTKLLYRYYRIFSDPAIDAICRRVLGLSVDDLYAQGVVAYMHLTDHSALELGDETSERLKGLLGFAACSVEKLREEITATHALDHAYAYRLGPLRKFPLVLVGTDTKNSFAACPVPTLLFWRLTSGLYYDLISGDSNFGNALGTSFEAYVGEVLKRAITPPTLRQLGQAKYGTKPRPKATPDWLLVEEDKAAAFIECKAKRITVPGKIAMGDLTPLKDDLKKLADAVVQLYERMSEHVAGQFPNLAYVPERKCYPVVVTLEDWYVFGLRTPDLLQKAVEQEMRDRCVDAGWLAKAPYTIMSVDEFEDAVQIINVVGISACFDGKLEFPEKRGWLFGSYLPDQFATEWGARKHLFADEAEAMFVRLGQKIEA